MKMRMTMRMTMKTWPIVLAAAAGCASQASTTLPAVRFANAPITSVVNDRRDVAKAPARRIFLPDLYLLDSSFGDPIEYAIELHRPRRALGVNALDEVPDSTWFTNRIGVRALTPDEIRTGPVTHDPEKYLPWTVHSTKVGGNSVGLIVTDAAGVKYVVKFDDAANVPEMETGTDVVIDRILWACGYNVAEDQVAYVHESDLVLAPKASVKDVSGKSTRKLDRAGLLRTLAKVHHEPDGRIRTLTSRWIDGVTLGGHPSRGVRGDDPNDRIPHELRRDLRGQESIYAWLDAVDVTEGQYVDTWISDASIPHRHYVKHYAIDFGQSLGALAVGAYDWWRGYAYEIDLRQMGFQLVTLGLLERPWQERGSVAPRGVSPVFTATYDPAGWHNDEQSYLPFRVADRFDKFWGAKIVSRFTRAQIHAAAEAGRFTDPRAADRITDTLLGRQRVTEAYWFARVNPLDGFAVSREPDGVELCFTDLAITKLAAAPATTRYALTTFDFAGHAWGAPSQRVADASGRSCMRLALSPRDGGYTIVDIATTRPDVSGRTLVHLATDPASGEPRVIGIWRP
jgi:hypothetical protein